VVEDVIGDRKRHGVLRDYDRSLQKPAFDIRVPETI